MLQSPEEMLKVLNNKFNDNNVTCLKHDFNNELNKIFVLAGGIADIGHNLKKVDLPAHQKRCCSIFDEVFSDLISAVYLASCAFDKPAHVTLRRGMELGLTVLYLWDLPHQLFAWEFHEQDLSFNEVINHLSNLGYIDYLKHELNQNELKTIIDTKICREIYSKLSDIVHGRLKTFECELPSRYEFDLDEWREFLELVSQICNFIVKAYILRFSSKIQQKEIIKMLEKNLI